MDKMAQTKIVLKGYIIIPEQNRSQILEALKEHIRLTHQEAGCITFEVVSDSMDESKYWVYEEFVDHAAFALHQARVKSSVWGAVSADVVRCYEPVAEVAMDDNAPDWQMIEQMVYDWVADSVKAVFDKNPNAQIYGAMIDDFYADGHTVHLPKLTVCTEERLDEIVRIYRKDYPVSIDEARQRWRFAPNEYATDELAFDENPKLLALLRGQVFEYATAVSGYDGADYDSTTDENFVRWCAVYRQFFGCCVRACERITNDLPKTQMVTPDFCALVIDDNRG